MICADLGAASACSPPALNIDQRDRTDRAEPTDSADPAEQNERTEPILLSERAEPTEPTLRIEPTEPIDRIEPRLAMDKNESGDQRERPDTTRILADHRSRRRGWF